jgi:hypothetical protein
MRFEILNRTRLALLLSCLLALRSAHAVSYQIQRSTNINGPYTFLANTTTNNFTDTTVVPGTTYYYVVAAYDANGYSTNSAPATTSTRTNAAPTLDAIADLSTNMNAPLQFVTLKGIGAGADESGQALTVTATSSNPALIPNPSVAYSSPNALGALSFTPVPNTSGSANITVTVHDNGGTNSGGVDTVAQTFAVRVSSALEIIWPTISGGNLMLHGAGGWPGSSYTILSSTNVALPLANWTPLLTNYFGNDGSFSNTIPMVPYELRRFYCLRANPVITAPYDYAIAQTATAPAIDGTVDALWSTANVAPITNVSAGVITNATECSGSFQLLYDATNLYVLFQITDDYTDHSTDSTKYIYYNDAIEVYVDANNTKTTNYVTGDFHWTLSLVGTSAALMLTEANNHTNGVVAGWHQTGVNANYVAEMKIPWSLVGQTNLSPFALLGFDAQIDHAHQGGTRDGELQWHDNADQDYHNPSKFGTARLSP